MAWSFLGCGLCQIRSIPLHCGEGTFKLVRMPAWDPGHAISALD